MIGGGVGDLEFDQFTGASVEHDCDNLADNELPTDWTYKMNRPSYFVLIYVLDMLPPFLNI
jgi:hypothetical protein